MSNKPPIHALIYGDSGTSKSSMLMTFPKPLLVWCFDPFGKDMPYHKTHPSGSPVVKQVGELQQFSVGNVNVPYRDVICNDGVIRVEYYHDHNIDIPTAWATYRTRMGAFQKEQDNWKTVGADSVTFMALAARKEAEKILNPMTKYAQGTDTRQWFAEATDALEEMVIMRFSGLPMNVVVICHIGKDRNEVSGEILRGPAAPGRLTSQGVLNAAFQEQWHMYRALNEKGERVFVLQPENDGQFVATTQIGVSSPCYPHYTSLWENWK